MNVEELIGHLERYPGYWPVEISIEVESELNGHVYVERSTPREVIDVAYGSAPKVVIR